MDIVKRTKWGGIHSLLTIVILASAAPLQAQVAGTMSGFVRDSSGAVVPHANLTAQLIERGTTFVAETNDEGFYNFTALEPGAYVLTVVKPGFQRFERRGLTLTVREDLRVDVPLEVGSVNQSVEVTAAAPLVNTTSATTSGLVDDRRIVDLPLDGRNVMGLAEIVPGVVNVNAPEYMTDVRSGPIMNVNGGRAGNNLFTLDGAYFLNPARNTGLNYPPPDAVQEFRIATSGFEPEYGFNSGSQITVVAKSGTNQFHGDAWEFLRNSDLNARNFFASTVPSDIENQFGATAGGPIKKDKLFYFGSFQGLIKIPQAVGTQAIVPSAAERTGDFTDLLPGTVLADPVSPVTGMPITDSSGNPCVANNQIAAGCLSSPSQKYLQYVPTSSTGTYVTLASSPVHDYTYFGRIDVNVTPKNALFGHFYVDHSNVATPITGSFATFVHSTTDYQTTMVTLNDTWTKSPSIVNQVIVSFLRSQSSTISSPTVSPASLGIADFPQYYPGGAPTFSVSGQFSVGGGANTPFWANDYQFRDVLTWVRGRHTLKLGGEDMPIHWLSRPASTLIPSFSFTGARSGDAFADYMLGAFTNMNMRFGVPQQDILGDILSLFVQDEFKVSPRLMLTYGVRWEPDMHWWNKFNHLQTVRAGAQSIVIPDAPPGYLFANDSGIPRTIAPRDYTNFAPRFGFAWDVSGNGKTSVRGSYGVFFNFVNADSAQGVYPPFTGAQTIHNGLLTAPYDSIGATPPPLVPTGKFGCDKISTFPGVSCALFPLPIALTWGISPTLETPYVQSWNFSVQRQLTSSTLLEVQYLGNAATKLNELRNFNPAQFVPGTTYNAATGVETTVSTLSNANNRAIFEPGVFAADSWMITNDFRSWYHSVQAQLTKRMGHGVSLVASYTLAKTVDMCSGYCEACGCVSNPFNLRSMRGRAAWDRRNAFVASYLWSPAVHYSDQWKRELLNGWTFSGITTIQSGLPMSFYNPTDVAVNGTGASEHAFLNGQAIASAHPTISQFFNVNAFVNPLCSFVSQPFNPQAVEKQNCTPDGIQYSLLGQYGQSGRNILSGPGFSTTDFAVIRDFTFTERYKGEFRAELFNFFNQVNFGNPGNTVSTSSFGHIQSANPGRVVQFALKFFW